MLRRPRALPPATRLAGSVTVVASLLLLTGCAADSPGEDGTAPSRPSSAATSTGGTGDPADGTTGSATTGGPGTTPTATAPVDAADAVQGKSRAYTVIPPEGWGEATDEVGTIPGIDLVLMSSEKVAGFNTNLVIHVAAGDATLLEAELAKGRDDLREQGRAVTDAPEITVAGARATGFTTSFSQQGVDVVARSYGLHRDGRVYLLTLSSARSAAAQAAAALDTLVESWTWA
ncbi:hypothetical protein [Intrasporangium sp.]|uniref:hypothetical protein n=1 Tax=Intrasporangium sp. TaxID=1925024 RepID=UPI00293B152D|nr:hypothetical protein [Intrasporangium sp.]MDV3222922.1 hypothetical protein [Intrasporangium sp.]